MDLLTSPSIKPPPFMGAWSTRGKKKPLCEVIENFKYEIVEGTGLEGKPLRVRGLVQRSDTVNENNRIYPRKVWEKQIRPDSPAQTKITERGFYGELDHPDDGQTRLSRTSHIVTALNMNEAGEIWAEFEILPTIYGREAEALFRARTKVGASSRGSGEVLKEGGRDIVQDDFVLEAFDFVHNPSTHGAYPTPVQEHANGKKEEKYMANSLDTYRLLERSAQDMLRVDVRKATSEVRSITENAVTDLIYRLNVLAEEAPDVKPLVFGLLPELQAMKKLFFTSIIETGEGASNNMPPELLKKLGASGFKDNTQLPKDEVPPVVKGAGALEKVTKKEETTMAEMQEAGAASSKRLEKLLREMDAEVNADDDPEATKEKTVKDSVKKCESRLLRSTRSYLRGFKEDADFGGKKAPPFKKGGENDDEDEDETLEAAPPESEIPKPEDGEEEKDFMKSPGGGTPSFESIFREEGGEFEVPDPPEDLADADEEPEDEKDLPPLEAKLAKMLRRLVAENKKLRYQRKVTEAVAGHALATMTKVVKRYESAVRNIRRGVVSFKIRGQRIPSGLIPSVIESLIRKYKVAVSKRAVTEAADRSASSAVDFANGALPGVRVASPGALRSLTEDSDFGSRGPAKKSGETILDHQLALSEAVYKRMAPKSILNVPSAK